MSKLSRFLNRLGVNKQSSSEVETEVSKTVDASQENEEQKIINHGSSNKEKEIKMENKAHVIEVVDEIPSEKYFKDLGGKL